MVKQHTDVIFTAQNTYFQCIENSYNNKSRIETNNKMQYRKFYSSIYNVQK